MRQDVEHAVVDFGLVLQDLFLRNKSEMASSWADRGSIYLVWAVWLH